MRTVCQHITLHSFIVPHVWLKVDQGHLDCVPQTLFIHLISLSQCLTPCTIHSALCPLLLPLSPVFKGWSRPGSTAQIHENLEVTVLRTRTSHILVITNTEEFINLKHQVLQVRFRFICAQEHLSQEMKNELACTIPMPKIASRSWTTNSFMPVDIPQRSMG